MRSDTRALLLRQARGLSRQREGAEDLLQSALIVALEQGRDDLRLAENRRWLYGVMRNLSRMESRSMARRRARDADFAGLITCAEDDAPDPDGFVATLPPSLRVVALLALSGHTRAEIGWLLRLPDTALRKRLSDLAIRWRRSGSMGVPSPRLAPGPLPFGLIRRSLRAGLPGMGAVLASHDPDGHLFGLGSQTRPLRQCLVSQPGKE